MCLSGNGPMNKRTSFEAYVRGKNNKRNDNWIFCAFQTFTVFYSYVHKVFYELNSNVHETHKRNKSCVETTVQFVE